MPMSARPARATIRIGTRGSHLARWQAELGRRPAPGAPPRARRSSWSRSRPRATATGTRPWPRSAGPGLFTKEIQRALLDGLGRGRRPQPEGPADPGARGPDPGRRPAARGRGRRPDRPGPPDPRRPARRGDGRHRLAPPPGAAAPRPARPEGRRRPGERRDPAEPGARAASSTPWSWPRPGSAGSAWTGTSPSGSARRGSCRRWGRGPWGSSAGPTTRRRSPCSPRSTTRPPTARSSPSGGPWPSWKGAA